ncbi:MAG TPA: DnrO protein [Arenimonas sp.]
MTRFPRFALFALMFVAIPGMAASGDPASANEAHADAGQSHTASRPGHEAHAGHGAPEQALPARRWKPDVPLSRGMQRVRAATETLGHGSHGHLDDGQVRNIAAELKSAVETMFAECKLEPEPDAALHPLLARVLVAADTLSTSGFDADALADLQAVVARYPLLFDDPAWSASQSD